MNATSTSVTCGWSQGCSNPTKDPSGMCHHHRGKSSGLSVSSSGISSTPSPVVITQKSGARSEPMTSDQKSSWNAARMRAASTAPYLTAIMYRMKPLSCEGLKTIGVDKGWRVYIDFEWWDTLTIEEQAGALLHECGHVFRDHHDRARLLGVSGKNAKVWNIAGDLTINSNFKPYSEHRTKCILPDRVMKLQYPHLYDLPEGETTEWYYQELMRIRKEQEEEKERQKQEKGEQEEESEGGGGSGEGDEPDGDGSEGGDQSGEEDSEDGERSGGGGGKGQEQSDESGDGDGQGDGESGEGGEGGGEDILGKPDLTDQCDASEGSCAGGSGSDGVPRDYEIDESGIDDNTRAVSGVEQDDALQQAAKDIKDAIKNGSLGRGTGAGDLERIADELLKGPPTDWRNILSRKINGSIQSAMAGSDRANYGKSSRKGGFYRSLGGQVGKAIRPKWEQDSPSIAIAIDTSGSMGEHTLNVVYSKIQEILSKTNARYSKGGVQAFTVDSRSGTPKPIKKGEPIKGIGGGGTDMRVAYKVFDEMKGKERPDISILMTDGYTPYPTEKPKNTRQNIIVLVGRKSANEAARSSYPPPEWATVVEIDSDLIVPAGS